MRFAAYIDVADGYTKEQIEEALRQAIYELTNRSHAFDIQVFHIPSADEWQAGHKNTMTAIERREDAL